ncbi:glycosyltransferase family 87 protein [Granulicella cerasi]|uniref:Glycosyltransferase family 87 protein n=1 Tax=Granulicella cerasi TaxID=741063 RepID=A0ABW1ZAJ0_9BACT|nr:glycosyltransferase family 87 protein [Granulicella cerasi]
MAQRETRTWQWLLLILGVAAFLWTARSEGSYGDFMPVYGSTRAAAEAHNPYLTQNAEQALLHSGAKPEWMAPPFWQEHSLVYPPATYYALLPLGWMSYSHATALWFTALAIALVGASILLLLLAPPPAKSSVAVGVMLVLATSGGLLRLGQISALAIGLAAIGGMLMAVGRARVFGCFCLGLAAIYKPQIGAPILLYFCFPQRTRKFAAVALLSFVLLEVAAGMALSGELHTTAWKADLHDQLQGGSSLHIVRGGKPDTGLIDAHALTVEVFPTDRSAALAAELITLVGVGLLAVGLTRAAPQDGTTRDLIGLAAVSVLLLLPVYHRSYDMRMLLLTLPALGVLWRIAPRWAAAISLGSVFLLFSTAKIILDHTHFSFATQQSVPFKLLVVHQQPLFVLIVALLWGGAALALSRSHDIKSSS